MKYKKHFFLEQSEGWEKGNDFVSKLRNSIQGLRQAAKNWNEKVHVFCWKKNRQKLQTTRVFSPRKNRDSFVYILT